MRKFYDKITAWLVRNTDKVLHFTIAMIITMILAIVLWTEMAVFITFGLCCAKEVWDGCQPNNNSDLKDVIAGVLGIAVAVVFILML